MSVPAVSDPVADGGMQGVNHGADGRTAASASVASAGVDARLIPHKTVALGVAMLRELADEGPLGVRELGRRFSVGRSTVHRILGTYEVFQIVEFDETSRRYELGPGLLSLVQGYNERDMLIRSAAPLMAQVFQQTGETIELSRLVGRGRMTIYQLESESDLRYSSEVGKLYPLGAGSTGRVLLACLSPDLLEDHLLHLTFEPLTQNTITDPIAFRRSVDDARRNGWAASWEEGIIGVAGCSVPIRGYSAGPAAIGIYGPAARFTQPIVEAHIQLLKGLASTVDRLLRRSPGPDDPLVRPRAITRAGRNGTPSGVITDPPTAATPAAAPES